MAGVALIALLASNGQSSPQGMPPQPASRPPASPALTLQAVETHHEVGWIFAPPGTVSPAISSDAALNIAWRDAAFAGGTSAQPILATLPKGGTFERDTLVWVIRYEGACVPLHGPSGADLPRCGGHQWNVIIDASTGSFIAGYSDR
jgi:hypothetical protein